MKTYDWPEKAKRKSVWYSLRTGMGELDSTVSIFVIDEVIPSSVPSVQKHLRLAMLKQILNKIRELLKAVVEDVRYVAVPTWKPWRDF